MKKWVTAALIFILVISLFGYRTMAKPEMTVYTQSVFPHNGQTYISFSFIIDDNRSKKVKLDNLDISTVDGFSYSVLPYEVTDYADVAVGEALAPFEEIKEHRAHTIVIGPVPQESLNAYTEVSLNFNHFDFAFNWDIWPED
ncbi:hypothetical protein [Planococcus dechangensis]|uniref:DUF4352 domain-containing protein n=1 Tax=Planococcus dechangensis TaxID=1176255 RepID=A0ABV9MFZ0_9BACL